MVDTMINLFESTSVDFETNGLGSLPDAVSCLVIEERNGEYEFNKFSVNLWNHRGAKRGVSIRYGKNLTDLKQEENCSAVYTGVYPFWCSEQDGLMLLSEKIVKVEGTYDFTRIFPLDLSQEWQDKPTEEQLRTMAKLYMKISNIGVPTVNLTVSFAQIAQSEEYKDIAILETVHLCDTVNVEFPELNVSATAKCIRTEYDALTGKYNKLELGEAKSNLASTISSQNHIINETPNKTFLEQAIENATQLITGGLGGHVVMHSSTGGRYPDEILIMDTDDIKTAIKVWRWNKGGLGYSGTGYMGLYGTAITADGRIVANFITAGKFNGALIKANTILASALSVAYKTTVSQEISDTAQSKVDAFKNGEFAKLSQDFTVANGKLSSNIELSKSNEIKWSNLSQSYDNISLEVGNKLNISEFSTKLSVSSDAVQIAWNGISQNIKFEGSYLAEINIYDGFTTEKKKLMSLGSSGIKIYNKDSFVGAIGTNTWSGTNYKGLDFDLDTGGHFMFWGKRDGDGQHYYMKFAYHDGAILSEGLHMGCKLYLNNNKLITNMGTRYVALTGWGNGAGIEFDYQFLVTSATDQYMKFGVENNYVHCWENLNMNNYSILNQSDARLKTNIVASANILDELLQLQVNSFDWIYDNRHVSYGLIAQELKTVFPELVQADDSGILSINYLGLVPYLLKAVQELSAKTEPIIPKVVMKTIASYDHYEDVEKTEFAKKQMLKRIVTAKAPTEYTLPIHKVEEVNGQNKSTTQKV